MCTFGRDAGLARPGPAQPGQPAGVSQVWPMFLMSLPAHPGSGSQEVVPQEVPELRVFAGRTQGLQLRKGLVQVLL